VWLHVVVADVLLEMMELWALAISQDARIKESVDQRDPSQDEN